MSKLTIMRGLPGSGKSTIAKEMCDTGYGVRLNKDLLRTMMNFDKFTGINEGRVQDAQKVLAKFFLEKNINVIVDDTNLNPGTLQSWKNLTTSIGISYGVINVDTPIEVCIERDKLREKKVGSHVIEQMAWQYLDYMKNEKVVVCDIDGTITDCEHRRHHLDGDKKDWKGFFSEMSQDSLRLEIAAQVGKLCMDEDATLIFVSARPEEYHKITMDWLDNHFSVGPIRLIMRNSNDSRDDTIVKKEIYDKYLKNMNVIRVFDDRPKVIRMWRELGLDCTDCGNGEEF